MIVRGNAVISVEHVFRTRHRMGRLMQNCMRLIATMPLRIIWKVRSFEKTRTVPVSSRSILSAEPFEYVNSDGVILARFVLRRKAV
jgi:hypothetical protein